MLSGAGSAVRDASSSVSGKAQLSAINASTPTPSRGPTPPRAGSSSGRSSTSSDGSDSPSYYPYLGGIGPADMISFPSCPEASGSRRGQSAWCVCIPLLSVLCNANSALGATQRPHLPGRHSAIAQTYTGAMGKYTLEWQWRLLSRPTAQIPCKAFLIHRTAISPTQLSCYTSFTTFSTALLHHTPSSTPIQSANSSFIVGFLHFLPTLSRLVLLGPWPGIGCAFCEHNFDKFLV